jgi:hypothetical protein
MNKASISRSARSNGIHAEVRQLRATAERIAASKGAALRVLAATGMYTLNGRLKPKFR